MFPELLNSQEIFIGMKHLSTLTIVLAIVMIISACGAPAAPTVNPIDVQSTAQAAAFTMIAETQAAIPTATSAPPTEIPTQTSLPTNIPPSLPTLEATFTAAPITNSNGNANVDPCATRVLGSPKGKQTTIRIVNTTKVAVTVSLYLNETEGQGECGYRSYSLARNGDVVITDLVYGCYSLWAWSDDPKGRFNSGGYGCINNPDKWTFQVTSAVIKFTGP